jgi:AcrR family transcriptional regulator
MARRLTNEEWSARTRSALLRAARRYFAAHGYERCSLDAIAAAASMTKGSIYHHYRDKRSLFKAVFVEIEREMVMEINRAAKSCGTHIGAIEKGCEVFLETVLKEDVARIVLTDAPSVLGWETWRTIDNRFGGRSLRAGLRAAMDNGEIVRLDVDALATLIGGALNEAALVISESKTRPRRQRLITATLRRLLSGLRPRT